MSKNKSITSDAIHESFARMIKSLGARHKDTENLLVLGIADGGMIFSERLAKSLSQQLGRNIPHGIVNSMFYRDDIDQNPIPKNFNRTDLPLATEGACVILADDVLFSGRTARAALNEIFDQGRPDLVELAVLFDRGNRRLPLQPNYWGFKELTHPDQRVEVILDPEFPENDIIQISDP